MRKSFDEILGQQATSIICTHALVEMKPKRILKRVGGNVRG
jgi:hypothetical protein